MANFDELYDVVMEANAYNKWANKLQDEYIKARKKRDIFDSMNTNLAHKKADYYHTKMSAIKTDAFNRLGSDITKYSPRGCKSDAGKQYAKNTKSNWMQYHGNEGESPEEKYKAGRYLDAQKKLKGIKESTDDLRLEIYESCRYGEISEEERDLLLEMI
jgi:hypothetical protein